MKNESPTPKRCYPSLYEKIVPVALGVLVLFVIFMLLFTILVGTGLLDFG
jgi:hypothetical protein